MDLEYWRAYCGREVTGRELSEQAWSSPPLSENDKQVERVRFTILIGPGHDELWVDPRPLMLVGWNRRELAHIWAYVERER